MSSDLLSVALFFDKIFKQMHWNGMTLKNMSSEVGQSIEKWGKSKHLKAALRMTTFTVNARLNCSYQVICTSQLKKAT